MLDFTSALYLGMQHSSQTLRPWKQLTTGRPAALRTPVGEARVAKDLAELIGCEAAVLGPSTLHLFWDLFGLAAKDKVAIYLDAGAYPIAGWGAERATGRGVPLRWFRHHDPDGLERTLRRHALEQRRPVIVTDGFCPGCAALAPLAAYQAKARVYGGYVLIDDTQALGIFGRASTYGKSPFGKGGGGSLRFKNLSGPDIVVISSLAKAFGVPVAVLAGPGALVERFKSYSETRVHSSPPSVAVVHAAEHALAANEVDGECLRSRLVQLARCFREGLAAFDFSTRGGLFPVQTLGPVPMLDPRLIHQRLTHSGMGTVLHQLRCKRETAVSFLITALHRFTDIEHAVLAIADMGRRTNAGTAKIMDISHERYEFGFRTV